MSRLLLLLLLAVSSTASAIVIRHDAEDSQYRTPASAFPALADMPGMGHGVLIAPQWIVTAAHVLPTHHPLQQVVVNGLARDVERVVVHAGYKPLPQELIDQAMASGEAMLIVVALSASDDIALVKLAEPALDVEPVALYRSGEEPGQVIKIFGKGATATGATGHDRHASGRTELRRAFNTVTSAHGRWFCYVFDEPALGLPLEGILGSGDSGGPVLVEVDDQWMLSGLAAWKVIHGDVRAVGYGRYGETACNVRLGHYIEWIEAEISGYP